MEVGDSLTRLENKWAEMISSTLEVEVASAKLEEGLYKMKQYEAQLIKEITELEKEKEAEKEEN